MSSKILSYIKRYWDEEPLKIIFLVADHLGIMLKPLATTKLVDSSIYPESVSCHIEKSSVVLLE